MSDRGDRNDGFKTVRIREETRARASELVTLLNKNGWRAVGSRREDAVSLATVLDEAVAVLLAKWRAAP